MSISVKQVPYRGWPNSFQVTNGEVELVLTGDVGPRIIRFGFVGGDNFFKEFESQLGRSGEPEWMPRGGHRLWIAPEDPVKSYTPDNSPIDVRVTDGIVEATEPAHPLTAIEKKITVRMCADGIVEVSHMLRNMGAEPRELAPWALTMMAQGGYGIHGFPPRGTHPQMLRPVNPLVMWAFSNLSDPRWRLLGKYLVLQQDPANPVPQKLGSYNPVTWGAYSLHGDLFLKRYTATAPASAYPDLGCSFEMFTNADMLELETLGPMERLSPGETLSHTEHWSLHRDIRIGEWSDDALDWALGSVIG